MLSELGDIAMAWFRSLHPTAEQEARAAQRLTVCDTCAYKRPSMLFDGYVCGACGCPLHKKIFTEQSSGCPKGKWSE